MMTLSGGGWRDIQNLVAGASLKNPHNKDELPIETCLKEPQRLVSKGGSALIKHIIDLCTVELYACICDHAVYYIKFSLTGK